MCRWRRGQVDKKEKHEEVGQALSFHLSPSYVDNNYYTSAIVDDDDLFILETQMKLVGRVVY